MKEKNEKEPEKPKEPTFAERVADKVVKIQSFLEKGKARAKKSRKDRIEKLQDEVKIERLRAEIDKAKSEKEKSKPETKNPFDGVF